MSLIRMMLIICLTLQNKATFTRNLLSNSNSITRNLLSNSNSITRNLLSNKVPMEQIAIFPDENYPITTASFAGTIYSKKEDHIKFVIYKERRMHKNDKIKAKQLTNEEIISITGYTLGHVTSYWSDTNRKLWSVGNRNQLTQIESHNIIILHNAIQKIQTKYDEYLSRGFIMNKRVFEQRFIVSQILGKTDVRQKIVFHEFLSTTGDENTAHDFIQRSINNLEETQKNEFVAVYMSIRPGAVGGNLAELGITEWLNEKEVLINSHSQFEWKPATDLAYRDGGYKDTGVDFYQVTLTYIGTAGGSWKSFVWNHADR